MTKEIKAMDNNNDNSMILKAVKEALQGNQLNSKAVEKVIDSMLGLENSMKRMEKRVIQRDKETREMLYEVRNSVTITYEQQKQIQSTVNMKANSLNKQWLFEKYHNPNYGGNAFFKKRKGTFIHLIYKHIKQTFNVPRYTAIRKVDFDEAMSFVTDQELYKFNNTEMALTPKDQEILDKWEKQFN